MCNKGDAKASSNRFRLHVPAVLRMLHDMSAYGCGSVSDLWADLASYGKLTLPTNDVLTRRYDVNGYLHYELIPFMKEN